MRKIFYLLTAIGLLSSCNSLLDTESEVSVTYENYFETEKDLESITYQMHAYIKESLPGNSMQTWLGERADCYKTDIVMQRNLNRDYYLSSNPMVRWGDLYNVIYMANVMLDNIYRAEGNVAPDRIRFHIGQACFGKGLGYLELARRWGDAVITVNSTTTSAYAKSPALEVLDTAISNAKRAYVLLPVFEQMKDLSGVNIKSKQFGSKGAAAALLVHAYAWKGSMIDLYEMNNWQTARACYDSAIYYATQLIEGKAGDYALEDTPEDLVVNSLPGRMAGTAKEAIFEYDTDYEMNEFASCLVPAYVLGSIGYPVKYGMTQSDHVFDFDMGQANMLFNTTVREMYPDGDLRRDAYFYDFEGLEAEDEMEVTAGCAYLYKWREEGTTPVEGGFVSSTLKSNYVYWRLADIYLLRAECYQKNGNVLAQDDLNAIRRRALAEEYPAANDTEGLQMAIFKEREKELLGEGHRYYDVIRNGYYSWALDGDDPTRGFSALTIQDVKDGALYLPVGSEAFVRNNKMTQNRYWVKFIQ
ncbi:MAG: RagB/SusD family nutrient uptake outer membrane protein [Odoribacter sp.]